MKKLIILFAVSLSVIILSGCQDNEPETPEEPEVPETMQNINGPTGPPYSEGPSAPPPST
jgi:PBP1b-binding outer membrane lipoprotein LpoB